MNALREPVNAAMDMVQEANAIAQTIKITRNPETFGRMPEQTDVDVSDALVGDRPVEWATDEL